MSVVLVVEEPELLTSVMVTPERPAPPDMTVPDIPKTTAKFVLPALALLIVTE
jgi:hypothetical protein